MESLGYMQRALRFGAFELDLKAGALRKHGWRIKLQEQPLHILRLLLEHPGEVVTRDELRRKLWGDDTFVDFDRSLNTAITKLRLALGDSAESPRFIETVPRRGYRFVAPVTAENQGAALPVQSPAAGLTIADKQPISAPASFPGLPASKPLLRPRYVLASLAALMCLSLLYWAYHPRRTPAHGPPLVARRSVAVLGFKNLTGDTGHAWLSTALSDWLSTELGAGDQLRVIPEDTIARMKLELALSGVDSLGKENLSRVKQNLGSDLIVTGSYASLGSKARDAVRLDVWLQDTATGEIIATISETGTESQLFDLVSRTGARLRAGLAVQPTTSQDTASVAVLLPSNPGAARLYSEGLSKLQVYDALSARDLFEQTLAADPDFVLGHSALATAWSKLGYDAAASEEAKKAFELSSRLPRAERLLIQARYQEASRNWQKAIETYRALFDFFPDNIDFGLALAQAQISGGKANEALETVAMLHNLPAPLGTDPRVDLASANAFDSLGDLKKALASAERAAEKARSAGASLILAHALTIRGSMLQGMGRLTEAAAALDESKRIFQAAGDKDDFARLEARAAHLLDLQGDFSAAKRIYEESLATFREVGDRERVAAELNNIATELQNFGDLNGARKKFEEALAAWSEVQDQSGVAVAKANLAEIAFDLGDLGGAEKMYDQSFDVCQAIGNKSMTAYDLFGLGRVLQARGKLNEAWKNESKALSIAEESGSKRADSLVALSNLLLDLDKSQDAASVAHKALQMIEDVNLPNDRPGAEAALAQSLLAQGKIADARKASDEALAALGSRSSRESKLVVATVGARVRAASGNPADQTEAAKSLRQIIADAKKIGFVSEEFEARLALAEVEITFGHVTKARLHLEALKKEASEKSFALIAQKADEDLKRTRL